MNSSQGLSRSLSRKDSQVCLQVLAGEMLFSKVVTAASFLIVTINVIWAIPQPGIIRERHVIHAPIKVRVIHHYKIKKIPLIIKKHLHYYKHQEDVHHKSKPVVEEHSNDIYHHQPKPVLEDHSNDIYHHQHDDADQYQFHFQHQDGHLHFKTPHVPYHQSHHYDVHEDDYEEQEQSKEEDDEDYEYE